jgi:hypothetical protein
MVIDIQEYEKLKEVEKQLEVSIENRKRLSEEFAQIAQMLTDKIKVVEKLNNRIIELDKDK